MNNENVMFLEGVISNCNETKAVLEVNDVFPYVITKMGYFCILDLGFNQLGKCNIAPVNVVSYHPQYERAIVPIFLWNAVDDGKGEIIGSGAKK